LTRLKTKDISNISSRLKRYNKELLVKTGRSLLGIASHAHGSDEILIKQQIKSFSIHVVPITAGHGVIKNFSETVTAILRFLGFNARVSDSPDTSGIAQAFENKADSIIMADDHMFVGINLKTQSVTDNSEATGRVFASALDLMVKGLKNREVLVQGCGPVGEAAARTLLSFGARVALFDIHLSAAQSLKKSLLKYPGGKDIAIEDDVNTALLNCQYLLEATPSKKTIPDELISDNMFVSAPGVPLGISQNGCKKLKERLIHDKLELGVAAMAISLLS